MSAVVVPVAVQSDPVPAELSAGGCIPQADTPQTFDRAIRGFRKEVQAMKKKPSLAGQIEAKLAANSQTLLRETCREVLQSQADGCSPHCPVCGAKLQNVEQAERTILTQWGEVTIRRAYGRCPRCKRYVAPADAALGLEASSQTSPALEEKLCWLATQMPPVQAAEIIEHLTGQAVSPSRIDRLAQKKGKEVLKEREEDRQKAMEPGTRIDFSQGHRRWDEPAEFVLIIMIDAWMVRERDDWGHTEALLKEGIQPQRWHEVKSARIFRLDQRAQTQSGRAILLASHMVATRQGPGDFSELLYTEAVICGLLRAQKVLVIADGAVWIWNIVEDRFSDALGTLDPSHAKNHLWVVAKALFGEGSEEASRWVQPLIAQLHQGQESRVIKTLADLAAVAQELPVAPILKREANYFETHKKHLDYQAKKERGEPIGSGAMESLCKQCQLRFKRPGQFWLTANDERLLELYSRRYNGRWNSLWPHLFLSEN